MAAAAQPLNIAVVGVGGIGSAFAYQLARAGHAVTVVARAGSPRLAQLQRDQAVVRATGERAEVRIEAALDEQVPYDLVIVTTLAHQVDPLLGPLKRSRAAHVQFMFNVFDPARLRETVGAERCSFGMPFIMAHLDGEGRLDFTVSASRKTLHGERRWADLFQQAGVASALEPQMPLWLRCHTPICVAMESISVAAQRRGGGASWGEALAVARGAKAGFAIVKAAEGRLHPPSKAMIAAAPDVLLAAMLWSVSRNAAFRDLLATGVNECRALCDALTAAAQAGNPPLTEAAEAVSAIRPAF